MELLRNIDEKALYGPEGEVWFGLFEKYIKFSIDDDADLDYAQKCAEYLNDISEETIKDLCEASIRYCNDFLENTGQPIKEFSSYKDVLSLVYPSILIIPDPESDETVIHMELNCQWEPEHGMEWVVRSGKVLYVGGFNGTYPWGEIPQDVSYNYA